MSFKVFQSIVINQQAAAKRSLLKINKLYVDYQITDLKHKLALFRNYSFFTSGVHKLTILARIESSINGCKPLRIFNGPKIIGYGVETKLVGPVEQKLKGHFNKKLSCKLFGKECWESFVNQIKG
jgi:hypothetical protein